MTNRVMSPSWGRHGKFYARMSWLSMLMVFLQTSASIMAFIHALYLFPEVSKKVYEEILAVTEGTRMPIIADRLKIPYTEAVWKEAFRWEAFLPMGIPHVNSRDEIVNGWIVKAGSQIIPNIWYASFCRLSMKYDTQ